MTVFLPRNKTPEEVIAGWEKLDVKMSDGNGVVLMPDITEPDMGWEIKGVPTYGYRAKQMITGSTSGPLTDYQMSLKVVRGEGENGKGIMYLNGRSKSWPNDVIFTDRKNNPLNFWIESSDDIEAKFWVRVPSIPASPETVDIYTYYGCDGAEPTSNYKGTFAGDFKEGSLGKQVFDMGAKLDEERQAEYAGFVKRVGADLDSAIEGLKNAVGDKKMDVVGESNHTHSVTVTEMGDGWKKVVNVPDGKTVTKTSEEIPVNNITIRGSGSGHNYEVLIDGKRLNNCRSADFHVDCEGIPRVTLELYCLKGVEIDSSTPSVTKESIEIVSESDEDFAAVMDSLRGIRESLNGKE